MHTWIFRVSVGIMGEDAVRAFFYFIRNIFVREGTAAAGFYEGDG